MGVLHYYLKPFERSSAVLRKLKKLSKLQVDRFDYEFCFHIDVDEELFSEDVEKLKWLISDSAMQIDNNVRDEPFIRSYFSHQLVVEIGPRLNFSSPFSTNAVSVCRSVGLTQVVRIERSIRYLVQISQEVEEGRELSRLKQQIADTLFDRMTECVYTELISSFDLEKRPEPWYIVDVIDQGRDALETINADLGLSWDGWDLDYYTELFAEKLNRNPTNVECFDLAQSNSEHSRHWFFKGILNIDGSDVPNTLFQIIMDTQKFSNPNNVIKFNDNSSAIRGYTVGKLKPETTEAPSPFVIEENTEHLIFTAETHNFPTAISPFSGAATGTGGRIRDVQAVGRGGHTIAGTAGYAVGNLHIPDYNLPWEFKNLPYSSSFAKPLDILIEASNGCSDYGNKFGEPLICGFTRSYAMIQEDNERKEYVKPILFTGGMGSLDDRYVTKKTPAKGMKVIKIGGPVYRIGVGGGAASSTLVQGDHGDELDYDAIQRGDPEMEQKLNRVVRGCVEHARNPILSIHDQGAGGNGNVLKELVEPKGAVIFTKAFTLGDPSISVLDLWGAEYQENNGILCDSTDIPILDAIAHRERCPYNIVGTVTGTGRVILTEEDVLDVDHDKFLSTKETEGNEYPVNLDLEFILGKVPKKEFKLTRVPTILHALDMPSNEDVDSWEALNRVLRHPTVCSKRFLTNKVDRSVTGLVAQQQCVGPLQAPVSDVAVTAISHFREQGLATSIGEQPIKGLLNPAAGARMSVAEALSNLVFAKISSIKDVKCSGNWMWPAKLPGEGANLYDACEAMCAFMKSVGVAIDGGKDSLSMAARLDDQEIVKAPGTLVISAYAPCPNIQKIVTPDLKSSWLNVRGSLLLVDISGGKKRLGGSVLVQCHRQLGDEVPDIENPRALVSAFEITQKLIDEKKILAGHDISDGGLVTTIIEMAIAGMTGVDVSLPGGNGILADLFAEECGWVIECKTIHVDNIIKRYTVGGVNCSLIGKVGCAGMKSDFIVKLNEEEIYNVDLNTLCSIWEETSYRIEKLQTNPDCAEQEFKSFCNRKEPRYQYKMKLNPLRRLSTQNIPVVVIREEGINGDREMAAALHMAGFEVWDCTMQDLLDHKITIDRFRGVVFPGGFSYADVFGAAKGWAAALRGNEKLYQQFNAFYNRQDTFSFGVCNGCQLMSLINWIGDGDIRRERPEVLIKENLSGRFESRFSTVKIFKSPAIMLNGMEDSILGVWVAHGEGRITIRAPSCLQMLREKKCIPLRYVDDDNEITEKYPYNPNGSKGGIAGICSEDGRHLAMMPHPERCVKFWQWPYIPAEWEKKMNSSNSTDKPFSPWFQIFVNAHIWCVDNSSESSSSI